MRNAAVRFWLRYGASPSPKVKETRDGADRSRNNSLAIYVEPELLRAMYKRNEIRRGFVCTDKPCNRDCDLVLRY